MHDFYDRLKTIYEINSINQNLFTPHGKPIAREVIVVPADESPLTTAAKFLSILIFPDKPDQRIKFVKYIAAYLVKHSAPRGDPKRKDFKSLTAIPNERIEQFLSGKKKSATYRLNMRIRAADVLWRKLSSSESPSSQDSLRKVVEQVAGHHTHENPGFYSTSDGSDEIDSFIKRVLWPSKPVIHFAMALYSWNISKGFEAPTIIETVLNAQHWLCETLINAEIIRVSLGIWFPHSRSTYLKFREENFTVNLDQTIAMIPTSLE